MRAQLVDAGRQRARSLGWTDCYTFTKAMTERMVEDTVTGLLEHGVPMRRIHSEVFAPSRLGPNVHGKVTQ